MRISASLIQANQVAASQNWRHWHNSTSGGSSLANRFRQRGAAQPMPWKPKPSPSKMPSSQLMIMYRGVVPLRFSDSRTKPNDSYVGRAINQDVGACGQMAQTARKSIRVASWFQRVKIYRRGNPYALACWQRKLAGLQTMAM